MDKYWLDILQSFGIVAGFLFTIVGLRTASKQRNFDIFWRIGDSHREIWSMMIEKKSLSRILNENVDLARNPVTLEESMFVNLVLLHIENVCQAAKEGYYDIGWNEKRDIADLLELPIPSVVWKDIRKYQSPVLVDFIASLDNDITLTRTHR